MRILEKMITMKSINIATISDASCSTASCEARTAVSQFKNLHGNYQRFPFINTPNKLKSVLSKVLKYHAMIFYTLVSPSLNKMVCDFANHNHIYTFDCLRKPVRLIQDQTGIDPTQETGMSHKLNRSYFDRIDAINFTIASDDGKKPENIPRADVIILGVSRTSKTPVSMYLANRGLKVVNIPVSPEMNVPKELWECNPHRTFGLISSVKTLRAFRINRLHAYGVQNADNTPYTSPDNIQKELNYAKQLYQKVGCQIIDVHDKSIEETSTVILSKLENNSFKP